MAEYINTATQTVSAGKNVIFSDTVICGNNSITHRTDSGLVTIKGITNQCRARFKITFGGNIAIPSTGTVSPISLAIAVNGEAINSTTMIETAAAVSQFHNVSSTVFIDVPCGCCNQISVQNTSTQSISVANANLIVERVA